MLLELSGYVRSNTIERLPSNLRNRQLDRAHHPRSEAETGLRGRAGGAVMDETKEYVR
jgi:hypothetical protein